MTPTYDALVASIPKPMPLVAQVPMAYNSPLTSAHKALRPDCAADVRSSDSLFAESATPEERPHRRAVLASVWLGLGMLDECHSLVQPESYAGSDAAYLHALLHRREGPHVGEVSMTGFDNARYWFGVLGGHSLFPHVRDAALALARPGATPLAVERFLDEIRTEWDPIAFCALCEAALCEAEDASTSAYCVAVQEAEWTALHAAILARSPAGGASDG